MRVFHRAAARRETRAWTLVVKFAAGCPKSATKHPRGGLVRCDQATAIFTFGGVIAQRQGFNVEGGHRTRFCLFKATQQSARMTWVQPVGRSLSEHFDTQADVFGTMPELIERRASKSVC